MKFIQTQNKSLFILFLGFIFIAFQLFFLPFHVWDAGIARPWYMLHGMLPYRDFVWIRMPFDLFLMEGWYRLVGANALGYQTFILILFFILSSLVYIAGKVSFKKHFYLPFLLFNLFLFPIFQNTEEGEILVGIFNISLFILFFFFLKNKKNFYLFFAGLISGLAFITKQNSVLVMAIFSASILFNSIVKKENIIRFFKNISSYFLGIIVPMILLFVYFLLNGGLSDFFNYTFLFLISTYSKAYVLHGDGMLLVFAYLFLLIPFAVFNKVINWDNSLKLMLVTQVLALFPSLLPSFLSYRAFTAYPLICLIAAAEIDVILDNKKQIAKSIKVFFFLGILGFLYFSSSFLNSFLVSLRDGQVSYGQYITSYGPIEEEIASLINKNSKPDDKIINYGSEMMYVLSDRLPANKYVDPFPYLLQPFEETTIVFERNPPLFVIYDYSLPNDQPGLDKWPVIAFFENKYKIVKSFDKNLVLFELIK